MLADREIRLALDSGNIDISPFDLERLGPASYDLLLDWDVRVMVRTSEILNLADFQPNYSVPHDLRDGHLTLPPGGAMLASTHECISVGKHYSAQVTGRSSMARLFQIVHCTAGFLDPGFTGKVTLEIVNHLPRPVQYRLGMKIAQVSFTRMGSYASNPYEVNGQYMNQQGVREANPIKVYDL